MRREAAMRHITSQNRTWKGACPRVREGRAEGAERKGAASRWHLVAEEV